MSSNRKAGGGEKRVGTIDSPPTSTTLLPFPSPSRQFSTSSRSPSSSHGRRVHLPVFGFKFGSLVPSGGGSFFPLLLFDSLPPSSPSSSSCLPSSRHGSFLLNNGRHIDGGLSSRRGWSSGCRRKVQTSGRRRGRSQDRAQGKRGHVHIKPSKPILPPSSIILRAFNHSPNTPRFLFQPRPAQKSRAKERRTRQRTFFQPSSNHSSSSRRSILSSITAISSTTTSQLLFQRLIVNLNPSTPLPRVIFDSTRA